MVVTDALADDDATAGNIQKIMKSKSKWCHQNDKGWRVEEALWENIAGTSSTPIVQQLIADAYKPVGGRHDEAVVSERLKALKTHKLLQFAGKTQQSLLDTVVTWTESLKNGKALAFHKVSASSGFVI